MTGRVLLRVAWRYLFRHLWQSILMVLGIALGVSVAVAVDLANTSASRAFDLSVQAVAGRATHFVDGGPTGLDEAVYIRLRKAGLELPITPVISEYVSSPQLGNALFQLLGIDAFSEGPFHGYVSTDGAGGSLALKDLEAFLTRPGAVLVSTDVASRFNLSIGEEIELEIAGKSRQAFLAGLVQPGDDLGRRALNGLVLADIATAQELTGRFGKLDRIDLIIEGKNPARQIAQIQGLLPQGIPVQPGEARTGTLQQMTSAFEVNLTALSLLALVVGLFLIYNTMTFSVVQRRALFGTLRTLGVTQLEIFGLVVVEALIVGVIGAMLGIALGILMGQGAVRVVARTINDLFFVLNVKGVQIPTASLLKGAVMGILATVLTAILPAWEAASVPPRLAMSRSGLEYKARSAVRLVAVGGLLSNALGAGILWVSQQNLVLSFVGTSAVVVGFAMLAPAATILLTRFVTPLIGWAWGTLGRMASRDVVRSLSRTSVAVASLMVAVSVTIGVSLMISSFRYTVVAWLDEVLSGDIYISAPSLIATQSSAPLDPRIPGILMATPGVNKVFSLRSTSVNSPQGMIQVSASSNPQVGSERLYQRLDIPKEKLAEAMRQGAVVISEVLANRLKLNARGAVLTLYTDHGTREFPIIGVYYDYSSTQGIVLMTQDVYHQYWDDPVITSAALRLMPGVDPEKMTQDLQKILASVQRLNIRPNRALKAEVITVFDRTFAITSALQLLATVVAFIGVLSALLLLELDRQRELGILRSIGMTGRQLWRVLMIETGLLGAVAGILAMPTGFILAEILVYIINKRSFGWTLQMQLVPAPFLQALILAEVAALLAGIYPAWRMSRMIAIEAMRFE